MNPSKPMTPRGRVLWIVLFVAFAATGGVIWVGLAKPRRQAPEPASSPAPGLEPRVNTDPPVVSSSGSDLGSATPPDTESTTFVLRVTLDADEDELPDIKILSNENPERPEIAPRDEHAQVVVDGGASPLPWPESLSKGYYWIKAAGCSWSCVYLDPSRNQTVVLEPGGNLAMTFDPADLGAHKNVSLVRSSKVHTPINPVGAPFVPPNPVSLERGDVGPSPTIEITGIPEGYYRLNASSIPASPTGPYRRGKVERVAIFPGETTRVSVPMIENSLGRVNRVPLHGTLSLPPSCKGQPIRLIAEATNPEDKKRSSPKRTQIWGQAMRSIGGDPLFLEWEMNVPVPPQSFGVEFRLDLEMKQMTSGSIFNVYCTVPPQGMKGVQIEVPEIAEVLFSLKESESGEKIDDSFIYWRQAPTHSHPDPSWNPIYDLSNNGLARLRLPPQTIEIYLGDRRYEVVPANGREPGVSTPGRGNGGLRLDVRAGTQTKALVLRPIPVQGVTLSFTDQGRNLQLGYDFWTEVKIQGHLPNHELIVDRSFRGTQWTVYLKRAGAVSLTFPRIRGYRSLPPTLIEVPENTVVKRSFELEAK